MTDRYEVYTIKAEYVEEISDWLEDQGEDPDNLFFSGYPYIHLDGCSFLTIPNDDIRIMFKLMWHHALSNRSIKIASVTAPNFK